MEAIRQMQRRRLQGEEGFTMIELLIVLQIIGILLLLAAPSYLGMRDRAAKRAAQSNLRNALAAATTYGDDHNQTFTGMTLASLQAISPGVSSGIVVKSATATSYCLTNTVRGWIAYVKGPGGTPTLTAVC